MPPELVIVHNNVAPYRLPLFESLNERYDVTVLFCQEREQGRKWSTELDGYSFEWKILPGRSTPFGILNPTLLVELACRELKAVVLADAPELVFDNLLAAAYATYRDIPLIVWTETIRSGDGEYILNPGPTTSIKQSAVQPLRDRLYTSADVVLAYSEMAARYVVGRGIDDGKIVAGPQIMPTTSLARRPTSVPEIGEKTTVLSLGYLTRRKGVDTLIRAYDRVATENTELLIVGDGPDRDRLETIADEREDVRFAGYVDDDEIETYYRRADVFVLPTLFDAWGLVVNEAMYYGLPVITTDMAGASELVERHGSGEVVESANIEALAEVLARLIRNEEYRIELARQSLSTSEICDLDVGVRPFEEVLGQAIDD